MTIESKVDTVPRMADAGTDTSNDPARIAGPVVVTGAGGGIGAATALHLACSGVPLAICDRDGDALAAVEVRCLDAGAPVLSVVMDQTDDQQVHDGVGRIVERYGRIAGLFANAGYGQFAPFLDTSPRSWARHIDINISGTFRVCQAIARQLVEQRSGGAIVLTASSGSHTYADQLFAYCTTKAAIAMMGTGMASELGVHRIRVNVISPGVIETPMTSTMLDDPRYRGLMTSETPVGRLGDPADVAALVAFLLSDDAAFINGANVPIDGGQTIHGFPRWFRQDYRNAHEPTWHVPA